MTGSPGAVRAAPRTTAARWPSSWRSCSAGGVLLGFLALVIDVGELYLERQQLQSGADSAALAIANACAKSQSSCTNAGTIAALAQGYANQNSADGVSRVAEICGNVPGNKLPDCGTPNNNQTDCLGAAPADPAPYVQVRLSTQLPDGRFILPPEFAQAMAGNQGYQGTSVGACARAGWQSSVNILSMTISQCEWDADTNTGHDFGDPHNPSRFDESLIMVWDQNFDCPGTHPEYDPPPPAGDDPRGYGEGQVGFVNTSTSCTATVPDDGNLGGLFWEHKDFTVLPQPCENAVRQLRTSQATVYLPVYDKQTRPGGDVVFHIKALAPFVVTGYQFGPPVLGPPPADVFHYATSTVTNLAPCFELHQRCLSGFFTGALVQLTDVIPSTNTIVKLIG